MISNFDSLLAFPSLVASFVFVCVVTLLLWLFKCNQRSTDFPPGPPTLPVLGNLHQMPLGHPYLKFTEWSKQYGDIVGLKLGPQNMIILNSLEHMQTLFVNRGSSYSGRPISYVVKNFVFPGQEHPLLMQNDATLRRMRTAIKYVTGPAGLKEALPMQDEVSEALISNLRDGKLPAKKCIELWSFEIAMTAVMGPVAAEEARVELLDRWTTLQHGLLEIVESALSSAYDMIPLLRVIPLVPVKAKARAVGTGLDNMYKDLFASLKQYMARTDKSGKHTEYWGLSGTIMRMQRQGGEGAVSDAEKTELLYSEDQLRSIAQSTLDAASDTTTSTALSCILALAANPELLRRAQEEVDRECGTKNTPRYTDVGRLPYLKACVLETLRWRPAAPLLLPHCLDKDDIYQGYRIPKDSMIMGNSWAIGHDPKHFPHPEVFDPERFMEETNDSQYHPFGTGRRMCPGDRFAMNSLMVALSKLVWSFDFIVDGPEPDLSVESGYTAGVLTSPKVLDVKFIPRKK